MNANPFRRRHRHTGDTPVESALRRSLARHAFETPDADDLTRRILATASQAAAEDEPERLQAIGTPHRDERAARDPWRSLGLPLVAAAVVAAVVGIGAVVASVHDDGRHSDAASNAASVPNTTSPAPSTPTEQPRSTSPTKAGVGTSELKNVKILDLTFVGPNIGFALASSHCIVGSGRCTALLTTTDGSTWKSTGTTPFDVHGIKAGCPADKCVDHIRFATNEVGYAYGPDAFFMTTNGGQEWTPQSGGAEALETLDDNVIRVRSTDPSGCPPGCTFAVETSGIGDTSWTPVPLPRGEPDGVSVQLSRGGTHAYLLVSQNPAGGSDDERSTLYASSNDGRTWSSTGEPCPQGGGEVDSYQVAAGSGDTVSVLCRARESGPYRVAASSDGGRKFTMRAGTIAYSDVAATDAADDAGASANVLADSGAVLAVAGRGVTISDDGGDQFNPSNLVGDFASIGFESHRVGRAVSADGTQIWTTRDAGTTWHESTP